MKQSSHTSEFIEKRVARCACLFVVAFEVICIGQHYQIFDQIINDLSEVDRVFKDINLVELSAIEWE